MQFKISSSYIIVFLFLTIVILELHETAHIVVGRIICGCWGKRDFNVWALCDGYDKAHSFSWLATLAGPVFSFTMMWLGRYLLYSTDSKKRSLGFSLIFANIPFGRISEAIKGAGDEMVVTRHLPGNAFSRTQMILLCTAIILIIILPPLLKAFQMLAKRFRWLYIAAFLTLPLVFILGYVLIFLNGILTNGFLCAAWIAGTPLLITVHTLVACIMLFLMRNKLLALEAVLLQNTDQKILKFNSFFTQPSKMNYETI
ncbi:MAG: hypothetical protein ABI091_13360 [Ferruginibacter sp.]